MKRADKSGKLGLGQASGGGGPEAFLPRLSVPRFEGPWPQGLTRRGKPGLSLGPKGRVYFFVLRWLGALWEMLAQVPLSSSLAGKPVLFLSTELPAGSELY